MNSRVYFSNPELNSFSPDQVEEQIRAIQEKRLYPQLRYCYDHSSFYRKKFDEIGAKPEDILTLDDLKSLPVFMTKEVERECALESLERNNHPFGTHVCAPVNEIYLTGTTSGTTGVPMFTYTFTKNDIELIGKALGHSVRL